MAAAVPFAIQGGMALYSHFKNKKGADAGTPAGPGLEASATGAATQLQQSGQQSLAGGHANLGSAASYYQRLLSGTRASMTEQLAPEMGAITETYRGATKQVDHSNIRGAQRDITMAELARDRSGKIADLLPSMRQNAAGALANIGSGQVAQGNSATAGAGSIYTNLLGQKNQKDAQSRSDWLGTGTAIGGLLADYLKDRKTA